MNIDMNLIINTLFFLMVVLFFLSVVIIISNQSEPQFVIVSPVIIGKGLSVLTAKRKGSVNFTSPVTWGVLIVLALVVSMALLIAVQPEIIQLITSTLFGVEDIIPFI